MALEFHQFSYMSDNYGVLIHEPVTGETAMVDAGDAAAAMAALKKTGWSLSHILITHHHGDHTAGLAAVKDATGAVVIGPDNPSIKGVDERYGDGDEFIFAGHVCRCIHTPGHTLDMLNYYLPEQGVCFTGDTLFSLGCGRIFEGDPSMMWDSLTKLMALPAETTLYSSHEYTQANAAFALSVDPDNAELIARCAGVEEKRAKGQPTVPSLLSEELATNPFLRASDVRIRAQLKMPDASDREVFAEIRSRKDNF